MYRVGVPLKENELDALVAMAGADCREPREQLRYLLVIEARRRGLLKEAGEEPEERDAQRER